MRRILPLGWILLLSACTDILPTPTLIPFPTLPVSTATWTAIPPTPSPAPTVTPAIPPVMNPDNIAGLRRWIRINNLFTRSLAFSPDSSLLAAASGNKGEDNYAVTVWRIDNGSMASVLEGFTGTVWDAAFSPNGRRIASAADSVFHERGRLHDARTGTGLTVLSGSGGGYSVAFSPDGKQLAVGGLTEYPNGRIWIYDAVTLEPIRELSAAGQNVLDLDYSADSSKLFSAGTDGAIRIWNADDGRLLKTLRGKIQADRISVTTDGTLLASAYCEKSGTSGCDLGGVAVWNLTEGKQTAVFAELSEAVAFSPDGSLLIYGAGSSAQTLRIRDTATWSLIWYAGVGASAVAVSPDGRWLATADLTTITIWSVP
jgi:WD40 repeat protein